MDEYSETEWRSFIKFSVKLDRSPTDIIGDLKKVMGDNTPHNATIYRWIERFRAGNQGCENEARSGRPKSSRTEENVAVVQQLITSDPQLSIEMIAEHTGLSYGNVRRILTEDLKMRRILAKWVPHELSQAQMDERKETSLFLLKKLKQLGSDGRKCIVTGDETYLYLNMPETRRSASALGAGKWVNPSDSEVENQW